MAEIIIYCDGGCRGNQNENNVGGWGVFLQYGEHKKELYGGERDTTNNQQELKGAINALLALKTTDKPVRIHCDSNYVVKGMNEWVLGWKRKGWKKGDGKKPENLELWKELDGLALKQKDIKFIKVKGHSDNEGNNRADELANQAMDEIEEG